MICLRSMLSNYWISVIAQGVLHVVSVCVLLYNIPTCMQSGSTSLISYHYSLEHDAHPSLDHMFYTPVCITCFVTLIRS